MRFYYPSVFSLMLLGVFYALAMIGLWLWWTKGLKRKFSGPTAWSVVALVLVAPWLEEFWIAWHFGQLCRKDAGVVINKTVEVEGYYDTTIGLLQIQKPLPEVTSKSFDQRGFKFYEMHMRDPRGGPGKVAHFEKINEMWTGTVIDKPTARYHYTRDLYGVPVEHKITRQEARVTDSGSGEILGQYVAYSRGPYWFFIHLSAPRMGCDGPDMGPNTKHTSLIYEHILKPQPKS